MYSQILIYVMKYTTDLVLLHSSQIGAEFEFRKDNVCVSLVETVDVEEGDAIDVVEGEDGHVRLLTGVRVGGDLRLAHLDDVCDQVVVSKHHTLRFTSRSYTVNINKPPSLNTYR